MKVSSVDDTIEELNPEPEAWQTTKSHSMHSSSMFIHYKRGKFKKDDFIKMMS